MGINDFHDTDSPFGAGRSACPAYYTPGGPFRQALSNDGEFREYTQKNTQKLTGNRQKAAFMPVIA
ncbi:MAG: hypothetical protein K2O18_08275 [Oscillospiraceae bacterium]|nr:hypothetical protein [Oscillospiraceae bacterium]